MNDIEKLTELTFKRIKERLSSADNIEQYFEIPKTDNIVLFTLKKNSTATNNDLTLSVGVCRKETDVLFSNIIYSGDDILKSLEDKETFSKTIKCIEELINKVDKKWSEEE